MKQIYTFILIALIQDDILIEDPDKTRIYIRKKNRTIKNVDVVIFAVNQ